MPSHRSWPTLALMLLVPGALSAQRVVADISIGHGPVTSRVIVGDPYRQYPRTVIDVHPQHHYVPVYRAVAVSHTGRGHDWYRHHRYRTVRIWYDADRRAYYDRYDRNHLGLRAVVVYERGGRYYGEGWRDDRDRYDREDRYDRYDRKDRDDRYQHTSGHDDRRGRDD